MRHRAWPVKMMKILQLLVVLTAVYGCFAGRPGCTIPLSKEDDGFQFSASSYKYNMEPEKAKKDAPKAWCAKGDIKFKEYIQINLSKIRHVASIETMGHKSSFREFYVRSFLLGYSLDGKKWKFYKSSSMKGNMLWTQFVGNEDTVHSKWNYLERSFLAKHVRIYPLTYKNGMCMKLELYGCNKTIDCTHIIKLEKGQHAVIKSPNYPKPYPEAAYCNWFFYLPQPDTPTTLITLDFDVGTGDPNRTTQYVELYKHIYSFSKHLTGVFYDGAKEIMPRIIKSKNEYLRIAFDAGRNNSLQRRGFQMMIWATQEDVKMAEGCENSTIDLDCSTHERAIGVSGVFYGQYEQSRMCPVNNTEAETSKTSCRITDTLPKLQESCDYHNVCSIAVKDRETRSQCSAAKPMQMFVVYHCNATKPVIPTTPPATTTATTPPTEQVHSNTTKEGVVPELTQSTQAPSEPSKVLVVQHNSGADSSVILIAAGCGAAVLLIIIITITLYCLCCKKTRKNLKDGYPNGIPPSERIQDINLTNVHRHEAEPNRYSPLLGVQHSMSNNLLYQKSENPLYQKNADPVYENGPSHKLSSSCDNPPKVRYIGASTTSIRIPSSVPDAAYIDVMSPQELPSGSIPLEKYLEPATSPPDHTAVTIEQERYVSSPPSSVGSMEDHYETMDGTIS